MRSYLGTRSRTLLRAASVAALLSALFLLGPAVGADAAGTGPHGVRDYWTPSRMEAAKPLTLVPSALPSTPTAERGASAGAYTRTAVPDPAAPGVRAHGKVFLTIKGGRAAGDYVCSGTAVKSPNRSVVISAGHCVFDTDGGGLATNWVFVPGYHQGQSPYGKWPARKLTSPAPWRQSGDNTYDIGLAKVAKNAAGKSLGQVVGGVPIGFNQPRTQSYSAFGYPAEQPPLAFDGEHEFRCNSRYGGADSIGSGPPTMWIGCDMTGGSSGGGWIAGGKLLSVNSYDYCVPIGVLCQKRMYGPYLGTVAKQTYAAIAGKPARKHRHHHR